VRALVVRFSAIGDCVMAVPVAVAIRRSHPDAFIAWAVESRCAPVVDNGRLTNLRHEFQRDEWKQGRWSPRVWRDQLARYTSLRRNRFDIGIDLQGHSKTALCLRLAAPTKRLAAYATDSLARSLNPLAAGQRGERHAIEWSLEVLNQIGDFGREVEFIMPELGPPPLSPTKPLATIAVGAGQARKSYPSKRWAEVARGLLDRGFSVAWLGGFGELAPEIEGTADLVGKLSLAESMAAIGASAVHMAADTGSGHIAAAYGVPVVSVFGPTNPAVFRPWTDQGIVLREGKDPGTIGPDQVLKAAEALSGQG
jgi:ADP-heptose:LPS heptosyltransferase